MVNAIKLSKTLKIVESGKLYVSLYFGVCLKIFIIKSYLKKCKEEALALKS